MMRIGECESERAHRNVNVEQSTAQAERLSEKQVQVHPPEVLSFCLVVVYYEAICPLALFGYRVEIRAIL